VAIPAPQREPLANYYAYRLYDIGFRRQTLTWAARWATATGRTFRVYGRGWERDPLLAPFAHGPVLHGEPLRRAYRAARLVLQPLPAGFLHQRSFEGLASGSLVVSRYAPPTFGGLTIGAFRNLAPGERPRNFAATVFPDLERVVFTDEAGFSSTCERLLADEEARERLRTSWREIVLREFTYEALVPRILDWVQAVLRGESLDRIASCPGLVPAVRHFPER
jgi:hypothetical protein